MWRRPGANALTGPLADWISQTDPLPEEPRQIRVFRMRGPFVRLKANGELTPYRVTLKWRGNMRMRDGDDVIVTLVQNSGGNLNFKTQNLLVYKHA